LHGDLNTHHVQFPAGYSSSHIPREKLPSAQKIAPFPKQTLLDILHQSFTPEALPLKINAQNSQSEKKHLDISQKYCPGHSPEHSLLKNYPSPEKVPPDAS